MIQKYENARGKMVNVRCQLDTFQIKWVNRLINTVDGTWKIIPQFYTDKYGKASLLFKMNLGNLQNLQAMALPIFYRNMLETWINNGGG